jgi:hypothetical protein
MFGLPTQLPLQAPEDVREDAGAGAAEPLQETGRRAAEERTTPPAGTVAASYPVSGAAGTAQQDSVAAAHEHVSAEGGLGGCFSEVVVQTGWGGGKAGYLQPVWHCDENQLYHTANSHTHTACMWSQALGR